MAAWALGTEIGSVSARTLDRKKKSKSLLLSAQSTELSLQRSQHCQRIELSHFTVVVKSGLWPSFEKNLYPGTRLFCTLLNHCALHDVACVACSCPEAFTQAAEPSWPCRKLGLQRELVFLLFNILEISAHTVNPEPWIKQNVWSRKQTNLNYI